jgi:hypothetical protein
MEMILLDEIWNLTLRALASASEDGCYKIYGLGNETRQKGEIC